jgi:hypothetical protein
MLVTITNIDPSGREVYVPGPDLTIQPTLAATIRRSWSELDGDINLKTMVLNGVVSLAFAAEPPDLITAIAPDASIPSYVNGARPPAPSWPLFTPLWNLTNNNLNWSDGVAWRDATGAIVP